MSIRIGLGLASFPFTDGRQFWSWIDLCERTNVDSVWLSERLISSQPILEPVTALAAIAGCTQRLKFGMNAVVLPLRDPLIIAKECATIDYLSGGRLLPVFGVGNDFAPEWQATGQSPAGRGARANECIELLARLWSEDGVTYAGKYYSFKDATISPKPKQQPLPLWIGGNSAAAIDRTARFGTGWLGGSGQTPEQAGEMVRAIKARLKDAGRSIDDDHYGVGIPFRFGAWEEPLVQRTAAALATRLGAGIEPSAVMAVGDARTLAGLVRRFIACGISKFVLRPIAASGEEVLEQSRRLASELIPEVHA